MDRPQNKKEFRLVSGKEVSKHEGKERMDKKANKKADGGGWTNPKRRPSMFRMALTKTFVSAGAPSAAATFSTKVDSEVDDGKDQKIRVALGTVHVVLAVTVVVAVVAMGRLDYSLVRLVQHLLPR
ncbi:hypothetical protein M434DRAFT_32973 [Hypoxylon sp. CO27-5]|nr:hypothetical protein M434DRAFT_32973 [Hypoxylon sp. CO27-5]